MELVDDRASVARIAHDTLDFRFAIENVIEKSGVGRGAGSPLEARMPRVLIN